MTNAPVVISSGVCLWEVIGWQDGQRICRMIRARDQQEATAIWTHLNKHVGSKFSH